MIDLVRMSCRAGLTPDDVAFLGGVLGETNTDPIHAAGPAGSLALDNPIVRLLADANTRDLLLDDAAVRRALLEQPEAVRVSPRLYFYVLVRHALRDCGINDRDVADYIASVLVAHGSITAQPATGHRGAMFYVTSLLEQMTHAGYAERFLLSVRLADLALLATGVFADNIRFREKRRAAPGLAFYESVGRAQYRLAGGHHLAQEFQLEHVYQTLADVFPAARRALNHFSEHLVFLDGPTAPDLFASGPN